MADNKAPFNWFWHQQAAFQAYQDMLAPLGLGLEDKLVSPWVPFTGTAAALAMLMATMTPSTS
jgi:hypothetical protein